MQLQDRRVQEKAVEEDPTVFQYDELYDQMDQKRKESKLSRKDLDRKPKYINKLLATAERRKKENERRIERQVQKEREQEGEEFKDKESFVTSAYRQKLEEMKELEAQEMREEYLESIGDVKKQGNLDGFYRHLYDQKVNYEDKIKKEPSEEAKEEETEKTKDEETEKANKEETSTKKQSTKRKYRKRASSTLEDENDEDEEASHSKEIKMEHLPSNLDADSDFSIDSSDSEDDTNKNIKEKLDENNTVQKNDDKIETVPKPEQEKEEKKPESVENKVPVVEVIKPKKPKIDIWKKRTVGEVFENALKRYLDRKKNSQTSGL